MSRKRFFPLLGRAALCVAALLACGMPSFAASPDRVEQTIREAVTVEAQAQERLDGWNSVRDDLLDEARTLRLEMQWLALQKEKLQRYVAANAEKINLLEQAQGRYAVAALELEHDLVDDLRKLEAHVASSPPFLPEERARRLDFLRRSLDDPELTIGEKLRRFTEGINAEVDYSRKLETSNQVAVFDGRESELIVIRAGTVGFYCLTPDKKRAGAWDAGSRSFMPLDTKGLQAVKHLETLSGSGHFVDMAELPALGGAR